MSTPSASGHNMPPHCAISAMPCRPRIVAMKRSLRYRAALASEPNDAITLNRLASALLVAGRLDDASRVYAAAIGIAPEDVGIQLNYAAVKSFAEGDLRLARLELIAARENALSDSQRVALHFALGKAYADLKDGERSFRHLSLGNALKAAAYRL